MMKLVDAKIFKPAEPLDDLPEILNLDITGEFECHLVNQVGDKIQCTRDGTIWHQTNGKFWETVYEFTIKEFSAHQLVKEKFYAVMAEDLGISGQIISVSQGIWELGRWSSADTTAKVLFVEAGVNDAELRLLLHTDPFNVICVLHHGAISLYPKVEEKAIACGCVEVVNGRMETQTFMDFKAIRIPQDPRSPSIIDLSHQMAEGFESIRKASIQELVATNGILKELEAISGRADEFFTQLIAGFGSDKSMADLFMQLLTKRPDGKPFSYADVGKQMGISPQAVGARFRKMGGKYPAAHRHLKSLRAQEKTTQLSAISPTQRRKNGVDECYGYDAD